MIKNFSSPKIQYQLVAEHFLRQYKLREANQNRLIFPFWCRGRDLNPQGREATRF